MDTTIPNVVEVDAITNKSNIRPMTAEEVAQREIDSAAFTAAQAEALKVNEKREAVLEALAAAAGLDVEEVKEALNV